MGDEEGNIEKVRKMNQIRRAVDTEKSVFTALFLWPVYSIQKIAAEFYSGDCPIFAFAGKTAGIFNGHLFLYLLINEINIDDEINEKGLAGADYNFIDEIEIKMAGD